MVEHLASQRRCVERIGANWADFQERRADRLKPRERLGTVAERVTESILEDLFTNVLDWSRSDLNFQVGRADLLLTRLGVKHLIIEAKRPGKLAWSRPSVEAALDQACRYADEQKVQCVGVSDGVMLYVADVAHGGLHDRVFVSLEQAEPPEHLWWLSVHGIYRDQPDTDRARLRVLPDQVIEDSEQAAEAGSEGLLHPKYELPARCFAYVGRAGDCSTWKLPYLRADGSVDGKRLPKAVQAILTNYRGAQVSTIPEKDVPEVLSTLARAAVRLGKMPHQCGDPAHAYVQLAEALDQTGRLEEIVGLAVRYYRDGMPSLMTNPTSKRRPHTLKNPCGQALH